MNAGSKMQVRGGDHLPDALRFLSCIPTNDGGNISWPSQELERGKFEVICNLTFTPAVDDHVKDGAVWHTLNECARADDFSAKFFLQRLQSYLVSHLNQPAKKVMAVAQINATASAALPKKLKSIHGPVEFHMALPPLSQKVIQNLESHKRVQLGLHEEFTYMICKVATKNDRSAIDDACRTINYSLGVMNLAANGYGISKRIGFPNVPIGRFLQASSIFTIDASSRAFGGWYSENPYPASWKHNFSIWQRQKDSELAAYAENFRSRLSRVDFKERVVLAVVLFQEGLESLYVETALLKFWTGIEVLCAKEGEQAARIVERASSIFDDPRHSAMRLRYIQEFRNKVVHRGETGDLSLLCAQYASLYLAALIKFFLWNRFNFRSRDTILDYMSMPLDEEKLLHRISVARARLNTVREK